MMRSTKMLVLLVALLSAATAQSVASGRVGFQATFTASNGDIIKLDTRTGTLDTPRLQGSGLQDCGDKFQICLTDRRGFAFAYFRKCDDGVFGDFKRLRFPPKIVSALHGSDVWMVFDAAPNYLFHYAYSKGIVGIYLGPTASFDFRSFLRNRNLQWDRLEAMEYRITSPSVIAPCSE